MIVKIMLVMPKSMMAMPMILIAIAMTMKMMIVRWRLVASIFKAKKSV